MWDKYLVFSVTYLLGILVEVSSAGHLGPFRRLSAIFGRRRSGPLPFRLQSLCGRLLRYFLYCRLNCPVVQDMLMVLGTLFQLSATLTEKKFSLTSSLDLGFKMLITPAACLVLIVPAAARWWDIQYFCKVSRVNTAKHAPPPPVGYIVWCHLGGGVRKGKQKS